MKEVIGVFSAVNGSRQTRTVIICQESVLDENDLIVGSRKMFRLDHEDGEELSPTDSPEVFLLADGSAVKKTGNVRFEDPENGRSRRSRH